jgi:hypothetical protein
MNYHKEPHERRGKGAPQQLKQKRIEGLKQLMMRNCEEKCTLCRTDQGHKVCPPDAIWYILDYVFTAWSTIDNCVNERWIVMHPPMRANAERWVLTCHPIAVFSGSKRTWVTSHSATIIVQLAPIQNPCYPNSCVLQKTPSHLLGLSIRPCSCFITASYPPSATDRLVVYHLNALPVMHKIISLILTLTSVPFTGGG